MEIPSKYNPADVEDKWYQYWTAHGLFHSEPDGREPYTVVIPPPNVTGVLHMGHMLNNTIQDILTRRARMLGKNACWVPGTDHASIATEAKVVAKLRSDGISKANLTREQFLEHAWDWTRNYGGVILTQLKKLGASCDWQRTCFTMDEARSQSVIMVFIDLYNKGLIYRGKRMVNWDPAALTALSDEEVFYREEQSKLYYLRYRIEGEEQYVTIATTRPETILGDTAVAVNPNDPRFTHLKGKKVIVPLVNRPVPIIMDDYVEMEFGTGCLKVTPAHDENDYEIGLRHNLEIIDIFNDNGTMNADATMFIGDDRFDVRKKIIPELERAGSLVKIEDYTNKVGYSERTNTVIEPRLSTQWFLKMTELAKPALENVMNDNITFYPARFKNIYRHWMENIRDWCISRQLWWGHRIPVYYLPDGRFVLAQTREEAMTLAREQMPDITDAQLRQDDDVLDTWFSSWLWPISVFDGIRFPDNDDIKYYYPTNDLVTAPDIIFFWVARMIITGYEYRHNYPFKNVYFTGIVRDELGRKMSKQLGNSPDPLELIAKYGADGVRVGMLLCSPVGGDLRYNDSLPQQGAGFATKIWNAFRLVKGWQVDATLPQPEHSRLAIEWFRHKFGAILEQTNVHFEKFRISDALMGVYIAVKDEFSGWLLEIVKPEYQHPIDGKTYSEVIGIFDSLLRMMHPFMPFVTEEIWQLLDERADGQSIMTATWPTARCCDEALLAQFDDAREAVSGIRNVRTKYNIANKDKLQLFVLQGDKGYAPDYGSIICKLGNLSALTRVEKEIPDAATFLVKSTTFFVPTGNFIDAEEELEKLRKELAYTQGFLKSVMGKLNNERFTANAPEAVVTVERAKKADAENRIRSLEEQIRALVKD
ncbi:MAG: valine--tRNA ligase [Bacteroidales bacterium]|jgi:valyl-tRNA synthetase|nr:valine--tRNA ligase [Bacteroidales bacterium]